MATGGGASSRRVLLQGIGVANIDPVGAGFVTFTRWTNGWTSFHLLPCVSPVSVRCPGFPGSPLAAFLVPTPFVRCKLPVWPSRGHHCAACHLAGVLGHRGFSLESAAARICREAGARVSLNVRVQDLDLFPLGSHDNRRIEIIADGLPLFHGAQLAVDTTMVSALRADGNPRHRSDVLDWSHFVSGSTLQRADLPRTDWRAWQSAPCCAGV